MNNINYNSIKLTQQFTQPLQNIKILQSLADAFQLRIQSQDNYQKAISRVAQKFSSISNQQTAFSKLLMQISRMHNQKTFQIITFKDSLKQDIDSLRNAAKKISSQIQTFISGVKKTEKDIKISYDKVQRSKVKTYQVHKQLDQKIILNEISKLNLDHSNEMNNKLSESTAKLMSQQKHNDQLHDVVVQSFKYIITSFNENLPKFNNQINKISQKIRTQYYDVLKKYTIHQISLLRNIQYDVDSTINKIQKQQMSQTQNEIILPIIPQYKQIKSEDNFQTLRLNILEKYDDDIATQSQISDFKQRLNYAISQGTQFENMLKEIQNNYENLRILIQKWLEGYRLINKFRFQLDEYDRLKKIFRIINKEAYKISDIQSLQKILLFSVTYYHQSKIQKRFLIEQIKDFKFYGLIQFWKFYCYYSLKSTLVNYRKNAVENQIDNLNHQKNTVYSTLLTCSTNMVTFGLEKHNIKNFLAKAGKSFKLEQNQIMQVLKFIQWQFSGK